MSDYQFMNYAEKRKVEINQSKNRRKTKPREGEGEGSEVKSSYRAYSKCIVVLYFQKIFQDLI